MGGISLAKVISTLNWVVQFLLVNAIAKGPNGTKLLAIRKLLGVDFHYKLALVWLSLFQKAS